MSESPTRILLLRHGMNDYLSARRMAGWTPGVHLNDEGRAQAAALSKRLAEVKLAAIYSSPLERTIETAETVAAPHGLAVIAREELGETRCGAWTGHLIEELEKLELWRLMRLNPGGFRFPGGESTIEMQARMLAALEAVRAAHPGQTVAVVSHSDPLKTALVHYLGMPLDFLQRLVLHPASISEVSFTPSGPKLLRCNDCAHLDALRAQAEPAEVRRSNVPTG